MSWEEAIARYLERLRSLRREPRTTQAADAWLYRFKTYAASQGVEVPPDVLAEHLEHFRRQLAGTVNGRGLSYSPHSMHAGAARAAQLLPLAQSRRPASCWTRRRAWCCIACTATGAAT